MYLYAMKIVRVTSHQSLVELFMKEIETVKSKKSDGRIHIGLAGGRSMSAAIQAIMAQDQETKERMHFTLVDERLEGETNSDTLKKEGFVFPLALPDPNTPLEAFDLVFLGIGEDGHFASLFPGTYSEDENQDEVILIDDSPKPPKRRATISYQGFRKLATAHKVFLLFLGEGKREALERALKGEGPQSLPVAFFFTGYFHSTIITDLKE